MHLFFSRYLLLPLLLTLVGCGGGSSKTEADNTDSIHPVFLERDVTISPSATPSGYITETNPTFTWGTIQNATEYQYGHQDISSTQDTWISYTFLAEDLVCNTLDDTCSHTPTDYVFTLGEQRAWWVRGKINGAWAEWSDPRVFTIVESLISTVIPTAIEPNGDISTTTPEFSWSSVQDTSEYQLGHENLDTTDWRAYTITKEQAGCLVINRKCSFTPENLTFELGDRIGWWIRAKVNDTWGEWSTVSKFTVSSDTTPTLIPTQITPDGNINTTTPTFSWSSISDATEYVLGHQETETSINWQQYAISPDQASCQNINETCTFTLAANTFNNGDNISWWVRAVINGSLQEWSEGKNFSISELETPQNVIINEVLASNSRTNLDPDFFALSDWIELYNPTTQDINISNFGLSDDDEDPLLWQFPEGTIIPANSYLLVWADDEDTQANALHTNFKISSKGETLTLTDSNGSIIDSFEFDDQESDISTAKQLTGAVFMSPTPGTQNGDSYTSADFSESPTFTFESGFFDGPITVALSQENGGDIYFTTDGSTPNVNSQKYTQPISINETSVIRAIAKEAGVLPSEIMSNSYFINQTSTLPIVSLTIDPDYLFDAKTGIYTEGDGTNGTPLTECSSDFTQAVNYAQEWERPSHLEYFGDTRESEFSLTSAISISGQCSRQNQKKSFSFELDSKFGTKKLEYKLFESKDADEFKDFKLRTGQFGYELSDVVSASLIDSGDLDIDYQAYRAVQMYVNGEYWGLYNFREKKGGDFIESNYPDIDKDEIDIINQGFEAKKGDTDDYFALEILLQSTLNLDLSNDADYQNIITMVDENNYIDYMALMIYSANTDWISSNQRSWKEKKEGAKWRWMTDDVDAGFNTINLNLNHFTTVLQSESTDVMVSLFKSLTNNATFRQKFKSRFISLLDSTFSPTSMLNQINTIVDKRDDYIPLENAKWSSINTGRFDRHVQRLRDFANLRSSIVRDQLNSLIPDPIVE